MKTLMQQFLEAYADEYISMQEEFLELKQDYVRKCRAVKMTRALMADTSRHDYLKYNDCMRAAARKLGIKTTRDLKTVLAGMEIKFYDA